MDDMRKIVSRLPMGKKIFLVRMLQRWRQTELAAAIGVSHTTLSGWESGQSRPGREVDIATRLEHVTGVPRAWWLGITDDGNPFDGFGLEDLIAMLQSVPAKAPAVGLEPTTCRLTTSGLKAAA